jgi:hypothetical protein
MSYLLLWRTIDKPTLFESEEFESYQEAAAEMLACHKKYPWNTYLIAQIETVAVGTGKIPHALDGVVFTTDAKSCRD